MGHLFSKSKKNCDPDIYNVNFENLSETTCEYDAMKKLWEKDLNHSCKLGLSEENFNRLICSIEAKIGIKSQEYQPRENLINCLKSNNNSLISCNMEINDFINFNDTNRINLIKERIQKEKQ